MTVPSVQPPAYGTPFSTFIAQSDVLKQALSGVSLIEDIQDVKHAQKQLKPGQALVSKEGILWRWDGLVRKGPASNEAERIASARGWMHSKQMQGRLRYLLNKRARS